MASLTPFAPLAPLAQQTQPDAQKSLISSYLDCSLAVTVSTRHTYLIAPMPLHVRSFYPLVVVHRTLCPVPTFYAHLIGWLAKSYGVQLVDVPGEMEEDILLDTPESDELQRDKTVLVAPKVGDCCAKL